MRTAPTLAALISIASVSTAQVELLKLSAADGAAHDQFGSSVAIRDDRVLVGAPWDDEVFPDSGAAYVFDATTGQELFKLTASDGEEDDGFGSSVAISGDRALVGAPYDFALGYQSGSAYVFDLLTGQELFKLTASDWSPQEYLGGSVAIWSDRAVVGAYGSPTGSAYVFDVTTGQELFELTPSDGAPDDWFGWSVAISGDRILVGARESDALGSASGSAYVFDATTGQELMKLTASDGAATDRFGHCVAIHGDRALVGAIYDDDLGSNSGSAYVFDVTTGLELFKLTASDGAQVDAFGWSVAIGDDLGVVGSPFHDDLGPNSGATYVFDLATGEELSEVTASDGEQNDFFGWSLAISGERAVAGARADDVGGSASGSAYLFGFAGPIGTNYCGPANPNSSGSPATINAEGFLEVEYNALTVSAAQMPVGRFGYFLNGPTQGFVQNPGGSQGNLCLAGALGRHSADVFNTGTSGGASLALDLTDLPFPGGGHTILAGETWNWTTWFRDKNPHTTSNFSDAISLTFQ